MRENSTPHKQKRYATDGLGDLDETAAESVVASAAWSAAVGERYDTARVCAMLGVSRQALSKRQRSGTLIGLRASSTTCLDLVARFVRRIQPRVPGASRSRLATPLVTLGEFTCANQEIP
ncbi:hypothetical protein [Candidatus Poriferisodalis sp.]|uniref:hypothetical protein n=1 Tax=Candidatus Poriferisodalis sp. TaxID=3101277 RepID=UPI003B026829